jgi:peptidoglycan/xylan/chitin deacetylase (PgdA/CDA1 family)
MRRVFRKGFAQKVARTSVLKHYGLKTLLYGVLLPGPDIGREAGDEMRRVRDLGFEVGLHTYDHVRWQDTVAHADARWTRTDMERGIAAFERVFGVPPASHAAAGWQINVHALELEQEHGFRYASDTRGGGAFLPRLDSGASTCPQIPTTLPTFDELLGRDGIGASNIADAVFALSAGSPTGFGGAGRSGAAGPGAAGPGAMGAPQVFTLHAELEGMLLRDSFEMLLEKWREAGAAIVDMASIHAQVTRQPLPVRSVVLGEIPGRSGSLAIQAPEGAARALR